MSEYLHTESFQKVYGRTLIYWMLALLGFLLSFYTNEWIAAVGYTAAFGEMALISGVILLLFIPFFFWGKRIRHASWKWGVIQKLAHWDKDREVVGESI